MVTMRSVLRWGVIAPTVVGVVSRADAQPQPAERVWGGVARPWVSPPGWFGPGPAWGRYNDPGPGLGWQYYGVPNGPTINVPPQQRSVNIGFGYGYGWPGWWGPPAAAGSFWTNGRSLYGPPVPTYGPTPGVFSTPDDDRRFFTNPPPANAVFFGLGWAGARSPSPRLLPLSVSVYPPPPTSVQVIPGQVVTGSDGAPCMRVAVKMPSPTAELWIEKTEMTQKGTDRLFESPPLKDGETYRYTMIARWTENGTERAESRTVVGTAGQSFKVDFTIPDTEAPGPINTVQK